MSNPIHDQVALEVATQIVNLFSSPGEWRDKSQLKHKVQVLLIDLLENQALQPTYGEPVYQTEFLGLDGGGWIDVDRERMEKNKLQPKHFRTRTLWKALPAAEVGNGPVGYAVRNLVAVARAIDKEAFAKGTQNVDWGALPRPRLRVAAI